MSATSKLCTLLFILLILISGCAVAVKKNTAPSKPDGKYALVQIADGNDLKVPENSTMITIDLKSNKIYAYLGCNKISGNINIDDRSVRVSDLLRTEMYCNESKAREEEFLMTNLQKVTSFSREEDRIYLKDEKRVLLNLKTIKE